MVRRVRVPGAAADFARGHDVYFPVVQECTDGAVHRWIEIPEPGRSPDDYEEPAPGVAIIESPRPSAAGGGPRKALRRPSPMRNFWALLVTLLACWPRPPIRRRRMRCCSRPSPPTARASSGRRPRSCCASASRSCRSQSSCSIPAERRCGAVRRAGRPDDRHPPAPRTAPGRLSAQLPRDLVGQPSHRRGVALRDRCRSTDLQRPSPAIRHAIWPASLRGGCSTSRRSPPPASPCSAGGAAAGSDRSASPPPRLRDGTRRHGRRHAPRGHWRARAHRASPPTLASMEPWAAFAGTSLARAMVVAILGLTLLAVSYRSGPRWLGLSGALVVAGSFALTGHAATASPGWLIAPALAVHVAGGAFWLGSRCRSCGAWRCRPTRRTPCCGGSRRSRRGDGRAAPRRRAPGLGPARRRSSRPVANGLWLAAHGQARSGGGASGPRRDEPLAAHPGGRPQRCLRPPCAPAGARRRHRPRPGGARRYRDLPARRAAPHCRRARSGDNRAGDGACHLEARPRRDHRQSGSTGGEPDRGCRDRCIGSTTDGAGSVGGGGGTRGGHRGRPHRCRHARSRPLRRPWPRFAALGPLASAPRPACRRLHETALRGRSRPRRSR